MMLNDKEASLVGWNVAQSQTNYNTASHRGLKSYYSMPAANDPLADPSNNGPASEPLPPPTSESITEPSKVEPQRELQEETQSPMLHVDQQFFNTLPSEVRDETIKQERQDERFGFEKSRLQSVIENDASGPSIHGSALQPTRLLTTKQVARPSDARRRPRLREDVSVEAHREKQYSHSAGEDFLAAELPL
jgi:hypothetical protein